MPEAALTEGLRRSHNELNVEIQEAAGAGSLADAAFLAKVNGEVDALIEELEDVATQPLDESDFDWLVAALLQWQEISGTVLRSPRYVKVPDQRVEPTAASKVATSAEIETWIRDKADRLSRMRKVREKAEEMERVANEPSSEADMRKDWHNAQVVFATQFFEIVNTEHERPVFARDFMEITPASYEHLEHVWLDEVKEVIAYFRWKESHGPLWADAERYYFQACDDIERLIRQQPLVKTDPGDVLRFLAANYLGDDGFDVSRERSAALINTKVSRQGELASADTSRRTAIEFCEQFYGNIVDAINGDDEAADTVIDVATPSSRDANVINSFEGALVVHFVGHGRQAAVSGRMERD